MIIRVDRDEDDNDNEEKTEIKACGHLRDQQIVRSLFKKNIPAPHHMMDTHRKTLPVSEVQVFDGCGHVSCVSSTLYEI